MLVAFVAMAAAITYNATHLQNGPHPAPMANDKQVASNRSDKSSQQVQKQSRTLPQPVETTASLPKSKTIEAIQRKLVEGGYEPGPVDGLQGQMTMAAIIAYQHDHDLPVTGVASSQLLKNMILGGSVGKSAASKMVSPPEEMKTLVQMIQKTLAELKYDPGPVDGLMGKSTQTAIKNFERKRKLSVTGRISGRLVNELMEVNGGRLSKLVSS